MKLSRYLAAAAVATMAVAPAMAAPVNPAASLSLPSSARATSHAKHKDGLFGGAIFITLIVAVAVGVSVGVIASDNSSSN